MINGCKHGKVDLKSAPVYKTIIFGVKDLKVVAKRCLDWISFHDNLKFIVVLNTQMSN